MALPAPREKWRHFKGNLYEIVCLAKHSENGELMVIYRGRDDHVGATWARPLEMWNELVKVPEDPPRKIKTAAGEGLHTHTYTPRFERVIKSCPYCGAKEPNHIIGMHACVHPPTSD